MKSWLFALLISVVTASSSGIARAVDALEKRCCTGEGQCFEIDRGVGFKESNDPPYYQTQEAFHDFTITKFYCCKVDGTVFETEKEIELRKECYSKGRRVN